MQFKTIITALDLTETDNHVLDYVNYFCGITGAEKCYFMHIIKSLVQPDNIALEFHQLFRPEEPLDEKLRLEIKEQVEQIMPPSPELHHEYEVHEGNPVEKMLHWSVIKNIDLVVFGRKVKSAGSGLTPRRMAHRLKSNILFVPEKYNTPLQKIVIPLDYSEHSVKAIEAALKLRQRIPNLRIVALHVIESLPVDHYPADTAYQQYLSLMKEVNMQSYQRMLKEKEIEESDLEKVFIENSSNSVPRSLREYLKNNPCDLVVIGAQGHSKLRNFFFGSTTERFIDEYDFSPVLIIR